MVRRAPTLITTAISLTVPARNVHARAGAWADMEAYQRGSAFSMLRTRPNLRQHASTRPVQPSDVRGVRRPVSIGHVCGDVAHRLRIDTTEDCDRAQVRTKGCAAFDLTMGHGVSPRASHRSTVSSRPVGYTCDEHSEYDVTDPS